jgi:hypothetical protein
MIKLKKIINSILKEYSNEEIDYELFELKSEMTSDILNDFLFKNNDAMTKHIPWNVISFPRLKKIWEDFVKTGQVRDERGLDNIENTMQNTTIKLWIITELSGHTPYDPDDDFKEVFEPYLEGYLKGYVANKMNANIDANKHQMNFDRYTVKANPQSLSKKTKPKVINKYLDSFIEDNNLEDLKRNELKPKLYDELMERFFWYYTVDSKTGANYLSDYGLKPLLKLLQELRYVDTPEEKVPIIDKMLNVVHQRSDMASWFVEGGSNALQKLSGMEEPNDD